MGSNGTQWVPMGPGVPMGSNEVQWGAMGPMERDPFARVILPRDPVEGDPLEWKRGSGRGFPKTPRSGRGFHNDFEILNEEWWNSKFD